MRSAASRLSVTSLLIGGAAGIPASSQARLPARLASRSQNAQSMALRAPPGGKSRCSCAREMPRDSPFEHL
jgi:hypothetical protein